MKTRNTGFTIMEIMIATAILTLGLIGILALFPVAIDAGRKVMERSTAVTIAKSVAEQIRSGIRNQKRNNYRGPVPFTYFIFRHDGVLDRIPSDSSQERPSADYYILLPQFRPEQGFSGGSDMERRMAAVKASREFVYPEDDERPNGGGDPLQADDDSDDHPSGQGILVKKAYKLGARPENAPPQQPDMVSEDYTFKQYFYAFSIRAALRDTNRSLNPGRFEPGNELYHVRVMIFRMFTFNAEKVQAEGVGTEPVFQLDFEVAR